MLARGPGAAAVCRVLRYVKRFVVMNPAPTEQLDTASPPVLTVDYLQKTDQRHRGLPHQIKKINEEVWTRDASLQKFMDLKNHFRS